MGSCRYLYKERAGVPLTHVGGCLAEKPGRQEHLQSECDIVLRLTTSLMTFIGGTGTGDCLLFHSIHCRMSLDKV